MVNSMGVGGAEKSLSSLLNLFDYERYEVYLQMISRGGDFEKLLPPEVNILPQLPYFEFCSQPLVKQALSGKVSFLKARLSVHNRLKRNIRAGSPLHPAQAFWAGAEDAFDTLPGEYDVAIAWGQGTPTHFVAKKVNARKKIAWVNVNYEVAGYQAAFDESCYEAYDNIVCVSDELRLIFNKKFSQYSEKMITILDINNPRTIMDMAQQPVSLSSRADVTLVTVGRLVPQKGYDIATKAAWILKKRGIKFHWYVVGGGDSAPIEKDIVQYGIRDCFTLLGSMPNPYPYMKAADIYVQTSKFEGYCLTLAEARMLNIPCVTTNFDVVYAQMIQGENGLVVEMNAEAVANGILRLATDRELYRHIKHFQEQEKKGNVEEVEKFYALVEKVDG